MKLCGVRAIVVALAVHITELVFELLDPPSWTGEFSVTPLALYEYPTVVGVIFSRSIFRFPLRLTRIATEIDLIDM
jgi:hypothetical protein